MTPTQQNPYHRTSDFNRRMEEGMRRAPEERARAVREFWNWMRGR